MTGAAPIRLFATVDRAEQASVIKGVQMVRECLARAAAAPARRFDLRFASAKTLPADAEPPQLVIASLLPDLTRARENRADGFVRWAKHLRELQGSGAPVFLCTIFRHVPDDVATDSRGERLVRIRELNLLAIELSHALGVSVVDIDCVLAHFGARMLQTDYRLSGECAAVAAGYAIARAVLSCGVDALADPVLQEKACELLGPLDRVPALIHRLERRQQEAAQSDG